MKDLIDKLAKLQNFINKEASEIAGVEGEKHFKQSFHDEAFSDKSPKDQPWQDVKRRTHPSKKQKGKASSKRPILTGDTGDLGESIEHKSYGLKTDFTSDKVYAEIHNKGGKAGRGRKVKIPERQYAGKSEIVNRKISKKYEDKFKKIFN